MSDKDKSKRDDDFDLGELSAEEKALAQSLGEGVDRLLRGEGLPRIAEAEEREFLELAGIVRASHRDEVLGDKRTSNLIEGALAQATGAAEAHFDDASKSDDLARMRRRRLQAGIAVVLAAAAALLLYVSRPREDAPAPSVASANATLTAEEQSRSANALVGQIGDDARAAASERSGAIFEDRMRGYRRLQFRRQGVLP